MIIESQFLLSFLSLAKRMGHKLYGIVRQHDFISNIKNEIYNIDNNSTKFKLKINNFIQNNDTNNLVRHLFWRPNVIFSIVDNSYPCTAPLFFTIARQFGDTEYRREHQNLNFLHFVLNCLFHFSYILLNETNDKNNKFLKQYFNFEKCYDNIVSGGCFWGIDASLISPIELIMKQSYFNGLNQIDKKYSAHILYDAISNNKDSYLSLISKYMNKNSDGIKYGINYREQYRGHLLQLFCDSNKNKDIKYLDMYLQFSLQCQEMIDDKQLKQAIQFFSTDSKYDQFKKMIQDYMKEAQKIGMKFE